MEYKTLTKNDRKVIIYRTLLCDGYNYYITLMVYNKSFGGFWSTHENVQKNSITSGKEAISFAKSLL